MPSPEKFSVGDVEDYPGEIHYSSGRIVLNLHRRALTLKVVNKADRPIQVRAPSYFCLDPCANVQKNPFLDPFYYQIENVVLCFI